MSVIDNLFEGMVPTFMRLIPFDKKYIPYLNAELMFKNIKKNIETLLSDEEFTKDIKKFIYRHYDVPREILEIVYILSLGEYFHDREYYQDEIDDIILLVFNFIEAVIEAQKQQGVLTGALLPSACAEGKRKDE